MAKFMDKFKGFRRKKNDENLDGLVNQAINTDETTPEDPFGTTPPPGSYDPLNPLSYGNPDTGTSNDLDEENSMEFTPSGDMEAVDETKDSDFNPLPAYLPT